MTRVKICGFTRPEDAALAVELGADALGLNFIAGPRKICYAQAGVIAAAVPPRVTVVKLEFLAPPAGEKDPEQARFDASNAPRLVRQLYGINEAWLAEHAQADASAAAAFLRDWLVLRVGEAGDVRALPKLLSRLHFRPAAIVLDTYSKTQEGGTGQAFDWQWIVDARAEGLLAELPPLVLAGGLNPDNVAAAIERVRPWMVDVSSGVEVPGKPGVKDPARMRAFLAAAKGVG